MNDNKVDNMTGEEQTWGQSDWSKKLSQQAEDSREYRHKLYNKVNLKNKKHILDVGCGTGAITRDIALFTSGNVVGVDIDEIKLHEAEKNTADLVNVMLKKANVLYLPFENESFDVVVFNIVLTYIKGQQKAINEMVRVTKPDGYVLATLEPDYAARIDYPHNPIGPMILRQMEELGADLSTGRKLKYLFSNAGLDTEVGMDTDSDFVYSRDDVKLFEKFHKLFWVYEKLFKKNGWSEEEIMKYKQHESEKIRKGLCFHFPPCFYAIGKKV
jgi:ubiquinone/menaquinone biosynthesis C-methylase UbiE